VKCGNSPVFSHKRKVSYRLHADAILFRWPSLRWVASSHTHSNRGSFSAYVVELRNYPARRWLQLNVLRWTPTTTCTLDDGMTLHSGRGQCSSPSCIQHDPKHHVSSADGDDQEKEVADI
jgi:hypothetical protein